MKDRLDTQGLLKRMAAAPPAVSAQMAHLLNEKKRIREWLVQVDAKIYSLETMYLVDTAMGNVIRGWDIDARPLEGRARLIEDKERLFSQSSFAAGLSALAVASAGDDKRKADASTAAAPKTKKMRKSKSGARFGDDAWDPDF